jgi:fluoride exporter
MGRFLAICGAGAVGAGLRHLASLWFAKHTSTAFPWGTLAVNVLGCFLLALLMQAPAALIPAGQRAVLAVGLLGGFTTYSSFNQDTLAYGSTGEWLLAGANLGGTLLACLCAGALGTFAGRVLVALLARAH